MVEILGPGDVDSQEVRVTPKWTSISQLAELYDCFILDCDGVIWSGPTKIDESFEVIEHLESIGKQIFFYTNNSTKLAEDAVTKMRQLGYKNPKEE